MRVRAPATSANLGPGFDVFGLALREPYDVVEAVEIPEKTARIKVMEGYQVPVDPRENTGGYVVLSMIRDFDLDKGLELRIWKRIKPGSGLGSSAATAAAAAYLVNEIFDLNLGLEDLVHYASLGEVVSAGVPHLDNVAPAIYGGFTIVSSRDPLKIYGIDPPSEIAVVVALPEIEKGSTKKAREVVPKEVSISDLVHNVGKASVLAAGMALKDLEMIKAGMADVVVEPARSRAGIIPHYEELKSLGEALGAGVAVSGAGPAVIGVIEKASASKLASSFKEFYKSKGCGCEVYVTEPGPGVSKLEER